MAESLTRYTKAAVQIGGALVVAYTAATTDGTVSEVEALQIAAAGVTAVGVYLIPNAKTGPARYLKGVVAFLGAALVALPAYLDAGGLAALTGNDLVLVGMAALVAAATVIFPNYAPQILAAAPAVTALVQAGLARRAVPPPLVDPGDGVVTTPPPAGIDDPGPDEGLPEPTPWETDTTVQRGPSGAAL